MNFNNIKQKVGILFFMLILMFSFSVASSVSTERLNFYEQEQHTINISNTGATADAISVMPTNFTFVSSTTGCTNPSGQTINCSDVNSSVQASFIISSFNGASEYELYTMTTTLDGSPLNEIDFINIRDDEIFNTLVEYGRGRGNYFYNSMGSIGSAGTGTGYNYVPSARDFELNYLHKVFNIKQYYSLANSRATDVSFQCVYPYHTVVREHMVETISRDSSYWTVNYNLPRIDGSWERMGFLGMDFDVGEYNVDDTFLINCTDMSYYLEDAYGYIVVDEDSFDMEVRSPEPMSVTASTNTATIGNGSSEVLITYVFTNDELYPLEDVMIEIMSPENALFIGVRGELWGDANDRYVLELTDLQPSESVSLNLVAWFDTSDSVDTSLLLSEGLKVRFVPTWEINAYNPLTYTQTLSVTDNLTVNYGVSSSIINIQTQLSTIESTTDSIENTVDNIENLILALNVSVADLSDDISNLNSSLNNSNTQILTAINESRNVLINNINSNITTLMTELEYMQGFNEELIFLVTDSVGMVNDAKKDLDEGNIDEANQKLEQSSDNLKIVKEEIDDNKKKIENNYKKETSTGINKVVYWFKGLFI